MKRILFILLFCFFLSFFVIYSYISVPFLPNPTPSPSPRSLQINQDILWSLVQQWRISQSLHPYSKSSKLCEMTDVRAQEIQTDYSHDKFLTRYRTYPVKISENLTGAVSEQEALTSWLKSASHSATLHKDYQYSCISCLNNLCVQIFSDF